MNQPAPFDPTPDTLYRDAACGLLMTAGDGTILRVNQTFCEWTGYAAGELIGQRKLQALLTIGGQIYHQTHWAPLLQLQGKVAEIKLDIVDREGRQIPMLMNAQRRDDAAGVHHHIAVMIVADRHKYEHALLDARKQAVGLLAQQQAAQLALRQAEARLRLALDSAQLAVWESDLSGRDRRYEDGVARLLGHPEALPVSQAMFEAAMDDETRQREAKAFAQALKDPKGDYACVHVLRGVDGQQRIINSTGQGVIGEDGQLAGLVGILQDVTASTRLRAAAEDRALLAEQMIGIVSHDLRNPLAVITLSQSALMRSELLPTQRLHGERIERSARRAERLISDLLDFTVARIGGGIPLEIQPFELQPLIAAAVDDLRAAYPQRTIIDSGHDDAICCGDPDRIVQLIGNLVSNACSYGHADSPVRVDYRSDSKEFSVSVHNAGEPIDVALIDSLFQPMMRKHGGRANRSVGLGLFIVSQIARAHGGDVTVESAARTGTVFTATFPQRAQAD